MAGPRSGAVRRFTISPERISGDRVVFDGIDSKIFDTVFRNSTKFVDETTIEFVAQDGRRL